MTGLGGGLVKFCGTAMPRSVREHVSVDLDVFHDTPQQENDNNEAFLETADAVLFTDIFCGRNDQACLWL
jgi:hypothetical protein